MRIAILSDIHGNIDALHAVLHDAARRSVDQIVNLGDSVSGPLFPRETAEFLMRQHWPQLAGNHERQVLHYKEGDSPSDGYARAMLSEGMLDWIRALPGTRWLNSEVFLCHGTPGSDLHYFLETVDPQGAMRLASRAEVAERLGPIKARVVACGHTHVPRAVRTGTGTLIVNPGSVGLPAYDDDHPVPHVVENGAPDARYAIIEKHGEDWQASLLAVPYDTSRAVSAAEQRNRPDWAHALATGYAMKMGLP